MHDRIISFRNTHIVSGVGIYLFIYLLVCAFFVLLFLVVVLVVVLFFFVL